MGPSRYDRGGSGVWRTVALLLALLTFFAWDRVVLAVSLPEIKEALALSPRAAGLIATAFTAGLALVAVPTGIAVRRFGFQPTLVGGALIFSAATAYPPLARGAFDLLASRILVGVGEGVFHVALLLYLANLSERHRATLVGLAATVYGLAASIGPSAIQALNHAAGTWHVGFYSLAAIGILLALPLMLVVGSQPLAEKLPKRRVDWSGLARFWPLLLLVGIQGLTVYSVSGLLPSWTRAHFAFTAPQGALALGAFGFGAMVGGAPMGAVADCFGRRGFLLTVAALSATTAIGLMGFDAGLPYTIAVAFAFGAVANSLYVTTIALAQESGERDAAVLVGLIVTLFYGLASISGLTLTAMADRFGYRLGAVLTYAALYSLGIGGFALFIRFDERSSR